MKKLVLNLAALTAVAMGSLYLVTSAAANTRTATCTSDGVTVTGDNCGLRDGHCVCWLE